MEGEKRSELEPPVKRGVQCVGSALLAADVTTETEVDRILQPKLAPARVIDQQIGNNHIN